MYRQIAEDLRSKIESGELPRSPHGPLPTEIDLREQYKASRNTVRDAIRWLITRGLVETRPGHGTFVTERVAPFTATLTAESGAGPADGEEVSISRVEIRQADKAVAKALRIEEGAPVVSRHQQRLIDETPWALQTSFYPMTLVEKGATRLLQVTRIPGGAIAYLAEELGIRQAGYRDTIAVRQPDELERAFFKLPSDGQAHMFEIFRVAFSETGDRIRLTVTVYPANRNRLLINVGLVPAAKRAGHVADAHRLTPDHSPVPARGG
jgi:GntR family transcriptional regulator